MFIEFPGGGKIKIDLVILHSLKELLDMKLMHDSMNDRREQNAHDADEY